MDKYSDIESDGGMDPRNQQAPTQDEREAPQVVAWLSWAPGYSENIDSRQTHFTEKQARSRIEFISPFVDGVDGARADALMTVAQHERIMASLARPAQAAPQPEQDEREARLRHVGLELMGVIDEYRAMPCESLRQRMFSTADRYRHRLNPTHAAPQPEQSEIAKALTAFVGLAEQRERELGELSPEMRECLLRGRAALHPKE